MKQKLRGRRFFWLYALVLLMICAALCSVVTVTQLSVPLPTSDPSLDEFQHMATQIIAGATASVEAMNNPILRLWGSIRSVFNPPPPTATPRRGIVYYPTSVPTLTSNQLQQLRTQWLTDIEMAVGFSHQSFEEAVDDFLQVSSPDYIVSIQRQPPQIYHIDFENDEYVAVALMPSLFPSTDAGQFLLFRVIDDVPSVIYQGDGLDYPHPVTVSLSADGFADYNGNGYPDIALYATLGTTCAQPTYMQLLEIREDGEVVNLMPEYSFYSIQTIQTIDIDGDGVMEIEVQERYNTTYIISGSCRFVFVSRYFAWNGTAYQDVSNTLDTLSYYPAIDIYWESVEGAGACLLPNDLMYEMLLSEYVRGDFADAWARLQPLLRWNECTRQEILDHDWEMRGLEDWVTQYLPESTPSP